MITSITFLKETSIQHLKYEHIHKHQINIDSEFIGQTSVSIKIEFSIPILHFRNHDYTWQTTENRQLANWYSPKIIKLENNQLVQANQSIGIWEVDPNNKNILLWHFNPKNSNPLVYYDSNCSKHIRQAVTRNVLIKPLGLLFPLQTAIEVSRSKIPFSAITCFTDHCDFDTLENLKNQRSRY